MDRELRKLVAVLLLVALWTPGGGLSAAVLQSRADDPATTVGPQRERAEEQVRDLLARADVAATLAAHGLTAEEVESRLAQLSDEDIDYLASHADQIQAGGTNVPRYIWILLGVFLGVLILAAIF